VPIDNDLLFCDRIGASYLQLARNQNGQVGTFVLFSGVPAVLLKLSNECTANELFKFNSWKVVSGRTKYLREKR
jgi:hypothetical protein